MTVAGYPAFSSCLRKDGPHPVSHIMDITDFESEADHLCPYGLRSSIQNFPFMLCMPSWCSDERVSFLYLINASTGTEVDKVMYCVCVCLPWPNHFTLVLILSHFYVFHWNIFSESLQDSLRSTYGVLLILLMWRQHNSIASLNSYIYTVMLFFRMCCVRRSCTLNSYWRKEI